MRLMIEGGILMKEYALPWRPGGYNHKDGWTADNRNEWVRNQADELVEDYKRKQRHDGGSIDPALLENARFLFLQQATREHGEYLKEKRLPWPGWIPVSVRDRHDKQVCKAYRAYFVQINPAYEGVPPNLQLHAVWPPDGFYEFDGKVMELVEKFAEQPE
jgi:hypothetical protein